MKKQPVKKDSQASANAMSKTMPRKMALRMSMKSTKK